ncbi:Ig-like domain-containing protein [Flavobacterium sp. LS1R47]|uniref:Ig-like domain-containing protein n=1 Tax=Flavobacterium frigoritolerans TaxID=2987686 RepID=A0A9X3C169_9FLAO|nr:Ig-like domain-containing protein [Flavobacterium frigoritolerans]MCV9931976.1 Ig-like domain-containing protein [Flavobacterium frigoritolerans]
MRKFILYFLLLPFFGFGQIVDLVKWNGNNGVSPQTYPGVINPAVDPTKITAYGGVNLASAPINNSGENVFFQIGNWPTPQQNKGSYDPEKYIQFTITSKPNHKIDLNTFNITYRSQGGGSKEKFQIHYSKDINFKTGVKTLISETTSSNSWTTINPTFSDEINPVLPNQIVYIRLYVYNSNNNFHLKIGSNSNNLGPTITGSTSNFDTNKILAINDYESTSKNLAVNLPITKNDVKGSSEINKIVINSLPSLNGGTVLINKDLTFTFNPTIGFTGKTSFTYTISNATGSSTATVFITVNETKAESLAIWDATNSDQLTPIVNNNVVPYPITTKGNNMKVEYTNWSDAFFLFGKWPTPQENEGNINLMKYALFKIAPDKDHEIELSTFSFSYRSQGGNNERFEIRYSKDINFITDVKTLIPQTTSSTSWTTVNPSFSNDINPIAPNETVYIRVYAYNSNNNFHIKTGASINGYVKNISTIIANNDSATTEMNQAIDIPILKNDIVGLEPLQNIVITKQPSSSEGTVIISSTKEATFTPAPNFTGTTSFTYTINNKKSYSSATVTVLVKEPLIKTVIWTGKRWKNGYPSANTDVIIEGNYDSKTRLLESYEILANVNKLIIKSKIQVTINEGETLIVNNNIVNDGSLIIKNAGALVQTNDNASYTGSMGSFEMERITKAMYSTDYTYWSSPLTTDSKFTLKMLSPNSTGNRYYSYSTDKGWELNSSGSLEMKPGYGYIVRAPYNSNLDIKLPYTANFIGKPNNGITNVDVFTIGDYTTNLIGNPYPSAISADLFYEQNKALIKGTFYFWTHNTRISSVVGPNGQYNYSPSDYISYNATGATSSGDTAYCSTCGGEKMTGNIASGQSFFVQAKKSGKLTYNNAMRVKLNSKNNEFSRASKTEEKTITTIEKNRVWLNLKNDDGLYNETLLGYITGATNDLDEAYDGPSYSAGTAIYSILNNENLVIQGRALPFDENEVIPLGIITDAAGEYTIGIESMDGFFRNEKVFLTDKTTNITTNLKDSRYSFKSESGTFNDRFSLRFTQKTLGIDKPILAENGIIVYNQNKQIQVSSNDKNINSIMIYDILGKIIYKKDTINNTTFSTGELQVPDQIVIVKIKTEDNSIITKKIIL